MELLGINDQEARLSLWKSILYSVELLSGKCAVFTSIEPHSDYRVTNITELPEVETSKLMEALCLLAVLLKADHIWSKEICNIFGKTGPLHITEEGEERYLWAQPSLKGEISSLGGRPDLLITLDSEKPTAMNIHRIIECKSGKSIGAPLVRAEFGKAYDLNVTSYLIWSFVTPSEKVIRGAKELGIDIEALGFDSDEREDLLEKPEVLVYKVANTMEVSRKTSRILQVLNSSIKKMNAKLLPP